MPKNDKVLRIPVSTYRLQLNRFFTFKDARKIAAYLNGLGITDIYSSPYKMARPGSMHGYDIVRPDELNPEIGTEADYDGLAGELKEFDMGHVLDIVPNHMCILGGNRWWKDVLENGMSSPYSSYFDIDWDPVKEPLNGKVLLPILGEQYGKALENGEFTLGFTDGSFFISYYDHTLPVEPGSYEFILRQRLEGLEQKMAGSEDIEELMSILTAISHLPPPAERDQEKMRERQREKEVIKRRLAALYETSGAVKKFIDENLELFNPPRGSDPGKFDLLDALLSRQPYRLALWRVATEEINYRRFFDINELAAIRVEQPDVFRDSHVLVFKYIKEGKITGLRVDHVDGLYNPGDYLRKLQEEAVFAATPSTKPEQIAMRELIKGELQKARPAMPFYVIGEKILLKGEKLPEDWPVYGTTGYDFLNLLNGIFIKTENSGQMDEIYAKFIKEKKRGFPEILYQKKKLIMEASMSGEINVLGHKLSVIAEKSRTTRDFTLLSLTRAIIEVIATLPVYRTYITGAGSNERDRRYIEQSVRKAQKMNPSMSASVFEFLKGVLSLDYPAGYSDEDKALWLDFVMRFQQNSGPVMAKGLEDTAFYTYNKLLSLNEVGGSPDRFGCTLETFHGQNIERHKGWPYSMLATSTHDTKRGEDMRARLNVITEMPRAWREQVFKWRRLTKAKKCLLDGKAAPEPDEEYHLFQSLLGAWPLLPAQGPPEAGFIERIKQYMIKALREAKKNSSWINPDTEYEDAVMCFMDEMLKPEGQFLKEFRHFADSISFYGMFNSLSQVFLKITCPGVPDFYQGTELWYFSLVDPDNRKPVDYDARVKTLTELKDREGLLGPDGLCRHLLENLRDGMIKFYVIWKALNFRKANPGLFLEGEYIPLDADGVFREHICSFVRKSEGLRAVAAAPRFFAGLIQPGEFPIGGKVWQDTRLVLPGPGRFRDVFTLKETGTVEEDGRHVLYLRDALGDFPLFLGQEIE